jgi:hypothetical protein
VDARFERLLRRLMGGEPLARALASVHAEANAAAELERALSEWVACGLFAGVRFD